MYGPKTAFQLVFCKLELELLLVAMGIYHIERWFNLVRYQVPHCYLCLKSRTNMEKLYFEQFIANCYLSFNKKRPCRSFTYLSLYQQYSDVSWHYVKYTPSIGVYFCKIIWQVAGARAVSVSVGAKMVIDNLVDCWFLLNINWLLSLSISLFKRWLIQM